MEFATAARGWRWELDVWTDVWVYGCMDVRVYGCMDVWYMYMYGISEHFSRHQHYWVHCTFCTEILVK